ncbi:MAG TPA: HipA domain-containing protein [Micromonosporaceae bacterium]|nr:HipA domain-containing protein [Micromonosporaceae bacterium]
MTKPTNAEVCLHGRRVGELRYDRGGSTFTYEDQLGEPTHQVLGQIFEDDPRSLRRARVGLPAWFANLLPEGELRRQIIREMGGGNIGEFTLLLRLGGYLPGAVTVRAEAEPDDEVAAENLLATSPDHPIRHSQAGVQLKYTVAGERLAFPASGNKAWWTVKLPDRALRELIVNEYLTMRWLQASGFDVPAVQVTSARAVGGIPAGLVEPSELVYLIERFDRTPTGRIHFEDFAQVADVGPMFKYSESGATYDSLATVVQELTGVGGYADYIRRLTAMLVVGNTDAHLKNWALVYYDGRTPSLAPIYDFHSLTVYDRYRYSPLALSLNNERVPSSISLDSFRRMAERSASDPEQTVRWVTDLNSSERVAPG